MGKSIRTVQRWERELELPVRRPHGRSGIVLADADELDNWFHQQGEHIPSLSSLHHDFARLAELTSRLEQQAAELRKRFDRHSRGKRAARRASAAD